MFEQQLSALEKDIQPEFKPAVPDREDFMFVEELTFESPHIPSFSDVATAMFCQGVRLMDKSKAEGFTEEYANNFAVVHKIENLPGKADTFEHGMELTAEILYEVAVLKELVDKDRTETLRITPEQYGSHDAINEFLDFALEWANEHDGFRHTRASKRARENGLDAYDFAAYVELIRASFSVFNDMSSSKREHSQLLIAPPGKYNSDDRMSGDDQDIHADYFDTMDLDHLRFQTTWCGQTSEIHASDGTTYEPEYVSFKGPCITMHGSGCYHSAPSAKNMGWRLKTLVDVRVH